MFGKFEALLNERRELADASALLAQDLLRMCRSDDDICLKDDFSLDACHSRAPTYHCRSYSHLDSTVAFFC